MSPAERQTSLGQTLYTHTLSRVMRFWLQEMHVLVLGYQCIVQKHTARGQQLRTMSA